MWSVGTSYFIQQPNLSRSATLKKVLTHPCLVAVYLGIAIMVTQVKLPGFFTMTVTYIGNCNAAITMFLIGTILADVPFRTIFNRDSFLCSLLRARRFCPGWRWASCRRTWILWPRGLPC